jgi:hypothetical protein
MLVHNGGLMAVEKSQQPPQNIVALQEASATRALQALSKALKEGTVVQNTEGKKVPLASLTTS